MSALTIPNVRLGYPKLFKPETIIENGRPTGAPRFGVNLHLPNDLALIQQCQRSVHAAYTEKWPDANNRPPLTVNPSDPMTWFNKNHQTGMRSSGIRVPLVWGPAEWPEDPNAADTWILVCASPENSPPVVVNHLKQPVQDPTLAYPGAEAYANVSFYGYARSGGLGVGCGINGVMLTGRDVGRFDSKPTMEQMFGDVNLPPPAAESFSDAPWGATSDDPFGG